MDEVFSFYSPIAFKGKKKKSNLADIIKLQSHCTRIIISAEIASVTLH